VVNRTFAERFTALHHA